MREFLPPLFQIATGLSFALILLVGTMARKSIQTLAGRASAFALIAIALGFFLLSQATAGSMNGGAELFIAAGAAFLVAAALLAASHIIRARSAD